MLNITIVGVGVYGSRIALKYRKFSNISRLKAVVGRTRSNSEVFANVPFLRSAKDWRKAFGKPTKEDIFDLCVHQDILIDLLKDFALIGAKNFILPKPIAKNQKDLFEISRIITKNRLNVLVASQWHYSSVVDELRNFVTKNKKKVRSVDIVFKRKFTGNRVQNYSAFTAFLPHVIQILFTAGLIGDSEHRSVEFFTDKEIKVNYHDKIDINIHTSIDDENHEESLDIFCENDKTPEFKIDFSSISNESGMIKFPAVISNNNKVDHREDILENMIDVSLQHFAGSNSNRNRTKDVLTFNKYLKVARELVDINSSVGKKVAVIGGGIFGIMSALEIAKRGHSVVVYEQNDEIMRGASLVNHCRIHMGYHYPRDKQTVLESLKAKSPFESFFGSKVVRKIKNYYLIAKEGSLTSPKDFLDFCNKMKLPLKVTWPHAGSKLKFNKDKISCSVQVPETIFDANNKRSLLKREISKEPNIELCLSTKVTKISNNGNGFEIYSDKHGKRNHLYCDAVVNATYGGINYINELLGLPLKEYQYELCEILIVKTPWKGTGWMIMDGPFFSAMPFGHSDKHLFYDVELSVLDRVTGKFPVFERGIDYYDTSERRAKRYDSYIKRWKPWVYRLEDCKLVSSMYVTRIVLPKREKTDGRPTIIEELTSGFWQIFSGKVATSLTNSKKIALEVHKYLARKHKRSKA